MKNLHLKWSSDNQYKCNLPGDQSGDYVRLEDFVRLQKAYLKAHSAAAHLTNYCEDSASVRKCEKELEEAEELYRQALEGGQEA